MKNKQYSKYKESGIDWLGIVPEHWQESKLKSLVLLKNNKTEYDDENPQPYIGMENIVSWKGKLLPLNADFIPDGISNSFHSGDILFGKLRPYLAKACIVDFNGLCSSELLVLKPQKIHSQFLLYSLLSHGFINIIDSSTYGSKMPRANWDFIGSLRIFLPSPKEQKDISNFLDSETACIDILIEKKKDLVSKLYEKRTALIHHAVTKGLNPNINLKDSGVEWLGMIPLNWEVMKLKYVSYGVQTGITPPSEQLEYFEEEVNWYTPADFSINLLLKDSKRKISELAFKDGVAKYFPGNSVLLVGIGATLGKVGYIDKPASSNQQINAIFFDNLEYAKYYSYYLLVNQPNVVSYANASTLAILNQAQTKDIPVIVPDFEEMKQIISYLEVETTKIDNIVYEVEKAISKLQEYRTALITATVTGKINVSN